MWTLLLTGCVRLLSLDPVGDDPTVPAVDACIPGATTGYALPDPRWGLASLHAERRLGELDDSALSELGAGFFLASAWQISGFGCDDYGTPWAVNGAATSDMGCLGISEAVVWAENCKLYPGIYDCDGYPGAVAGDQIEAQVMALAWFALAGHSLLGRFEVDPDAFYADATDPRAVQKMVAIMHFQTPWYTVDEVMADCPDALEDCLTDDLLRHVEGVAAKLDALDGADCYDGPLSEADVRAYVAGLTSVWPAEDWVSAEAAAVAALTGEGFARNANAVLDAIDATLATRLICPEQELWSWYRLSCP